MLFRIRDGVDPETVARAVEGLSALSDLPGIVEWTVRLSDDTRKGTVIVENALFDRQDRIAEFRTHPRHVETSNVMREIADWWIADYEE